MKTSTAIRLRIPGAILPTVALLLLAQPSGAAEDPDPDFSLEQTVKAGPFHLAPFLVIKDFGYDSNVKLGTFVESADFTLTVGPGARAVLPLGRAAALSVWDEMDFALFAHDADLTHVNNSLRVKLHGYGRDLILFAEGQRDWYRERPSNEIDYRIRTIATKDRLGATWRPASRGSVQIYYGQSDYHYDAGNPEDVPGLDTDVISQSIAETLERLESGVGLEGRLKIRPRTTLLVETRGGWIDFESEVPQRDSTSVGMMAGLEFDPAGALRGFVKLGRKHLAPENDSIDGYSGLIADSNLSLRILDRGDLRLGYRRNTEFSILGDNLFFVVDETGLSWEHFINGRFSIEMGRRLMLIDYPIDIDIDPTQGEDLRHRADDITHDTATIRYRMGPEMKVGLTLGRWRRNSSFNWQDYDRTTVTMLMEYVP